MFCYFRPEASISWTAISSILGCRMKNGIINFKWLVHSFFCSNQFISVSDTQEDMHEDSTVVEVILYNLNNSMVIQ